MKHNLLSFIFWWHLWLFGFVDPDLRGRWWRLRRFSNKAFGMSHVGGIEDLASLCDGGGREAVMNHGGGEQTETGVAMFFVVPGEKNLAKGASILDRPETFGKARPVFQRFEVTLRVRVVVGDMRAAMGFGDPRSAIRNAAGLDFMEEPLSA